MKFEKVTLAKSWSPPSLRRLPADDAQVRRAKARNPDFAALAAKHPAEPA